MVKRSRTTRTASGLMVMVLMLTLVIGPAVGVGAVPAVDVPCPTELFISEYIEGGGYNKVIEIYNGTGGPVDLAAAGGYSVERYTNGSLTVSDSAALSGTVADGDVYVIAHPDADTAVLAVTDLEDEVMNHNGDDALVLRKAGVVIDAIGRVGEDPGSYWGTPPVTTQDHTLVRKPDVLAGDTDETDAFDPAGEWDSYPKDTITYLGSHTVNCGPVADDPPTVSSTSPADAATGVALDADITINFSEDVTVTGGWYDISCPSSVDPLAAAVSGGPQSYTLDPVDDFANDDVCTVTVYASQVEDQDEGPPFDNMDDDYVFTFTIVSASTPIEDIQSPPGPDGESPLEGVTVTTEGIVTARFYGGNNIFIQDGAGPWTGLALYRPDASLNVGDEVQVTGEVSEYNGLTQIGYGHVTVLSTGNLPPAPEVLVTGSVGEEQWESVLVRVENANVTSEANQYGEWEVDDGTGAVLVDDMGDYSYVPADGDLVLFVQGPLNDAYGDFKIEPRDDDDIDAEVCGNAFTPVYDIQGDGDYSPIEGDIVSVEAVVTGDFQGSDQLRGFFMQDRVGDGNTDTSDGIFVYAPTPSAAEVEVGDLVRVRGEVDEYFGLTEITDVSSLLLCDPVGAPDPTPALEMPVTAVGDWEKQEGMLIEFGEMYATDNYNLGRYGEATLSVNGRLDQPTNVVDPGADAIARQDLNDRSQIQLDDGSGVQNPLPMPPYIGDENTLRAGDTTQEVIGCLGYAYGVYEVHPTEEVEFTRVNVRPTTPAETNGKVDIAAFNVLNYFTTLDEGVPVCGPQGDQDCRGADTPEEFVRQRAKIIDAILTLDADVVGLMELENHPGDVPIADLVSGLNGDVSVASLLSSVESASNGPTWAYIPTGAIGTDAIRVGFIYKPGRVTPVGDYAILDSTQDPTFIDVLNRPALAQTFELNTGGARFTAAVNHLKSKSSDCDAYGDPDMGDGQGNCNQTRLSAALALANWLALDPTDSGDTDYFIIGDLNSYAMEDPIQALEDGVFTNLIAHFAGADAYSYVYFGQAGYLDHALGSPDATARTMGTTVWHINADEPSALDYNNYNQPALYNPDAYRSSDHDPVLVGFCDFVPPELEVSLSPDKLWPPNHKYVTVEADVTATDNIDPDPDIELVSVTSNEPDNGLGDGDTENDIVILDEFTFDLRAERAGPKHEYEGDGRIYYITYQATDDCGNSTTTSAMVWVPHDVGKGGK
jgi:predicted extracellular nuclease